MKPPATPSTHPRQPLRVALVLGALAAALGGGCKRGPAAAKVSLEAVDAACAKGDLEAARVALAEAADQNRAFRDALEEAKANWGNAELSKINPCGVILEDLRRRLPRDP